jgi:hypothetical protein
MNTKSEGNEEENTDSRSNHENGLSLEENSSSNVKSEDQNSKDESYLLNQKPLTLFEYDALKESIKLDENGNPSKEQLE